MAATFIAIVKKDSHDPTRPDAGRRCGPARSDSQCGDRGPDLCRSRLHRGSQRRHARLRPVHHHDGQRWCCERREGVHAQRHRPEHDVAHGHRQCQRCGELPGLPDQGRRLHAHRDQCRRRGRRRPRPSPSTPQPPVGTTRPPVASARRVPTSCRSPSAECSSSCWAPAPSSSPVVATSPRCTADHHQRSRTGVPALRRRDPGPFRVGAAGGNGVSRVGRDGGLLGGERRGVEQRPGVRGQQRRPPLRRGRGDPAGTEGGPQPCGGRRLGVAATGAPTATSACCPPSSRCHPPVSGWL